MNKLIFQFHKNVINIDQVNEQIDTHCASRKLYFEISWQTSSEGYITYNDSFTHTKNNRCHIS